MSSIFHWIKMFVGVDWYFKDTIAVNIKWELVGLINAGILPIHFLDIYFTELVSLTGLSNLLFLFFIKLDKTSVLIFSKLISESLLLLSSHWLSSHSIFILFRPRNSTSSREDSTTFVIITSSSGSVSTCSGTTSVSLESFPVSVDPAGTTTSKWFKSVFAKYRVFFVITAILA